MISPHATACAGSPFMSRWRWAPFDGGYDDSTLSWAQLIGVGVCLLFCSGVGATAMWCLMACWARWHTKRQDLAPKMKEVCKEGDSLPPYIPPLVRDQGSQTDQVSCSSSSPRPRQLETPRKAVRKDILLDMARRAQPVIQEVEARKNWSVQKVGSASQGELC